jgi:small-conductance mechanosensitive channel
MATGRILTVACLLSLAFWLPAFPAQTEGPAARPQAPRPQAPLVELHKQPGDDLIKQAQALYAQASSSYLAELRGLATAQRQLEQAREAVSKHVVPDKPAPASAQLSPLDRAKALADQAKIRLDAMKRRLELVQAEKSRSDRYAAQLTLVRSVANAFTEALTQLEPFKFELTLRVQDGTLKADAVPSILDTTAIAKRKDEITTLLRELTEKSDTAREEQKKLATRLEEASKAVLDSEAEFAAASKSQAQQLKQTELEKQYAGSDPGQLRTLLLQFQDERASLRGAFNLARNRFQQAQAEVERLRGQLDALKEPDNKGMQVNRMEDYDLAAKAAQARIDYHTARLSRLQELAAAIQSLVQRAGTLEGDATVLDEHLFRMQVLSQRFAKANGKQTEPLPKELLPDQLTADAGKIREALAASLAFAGNAKNELHKITEMQEASRQALAEARERHEQLKKTQESTRQAAEWEAQLKGLKPNVLLERFNSNAKALQDQLTALTKQREEFKKATTSVNDVKVSLAALRDPLLRQGEQEAMEEKQRLITELHKLAGIEIPAPQGGPDRPKTASAQDGKAAKAPSPGYAQLLSARVRILDEQEKVRGELLKAIDDLKTKATEYARQLAEARRLALQQQATAIELKNRLGRGELEGKQLPDSISDGLKRDLIDQLGKETTDLLAAQTQLSQEKEQLDKPKEVEKELHAQSRKAHTLLDTRSELLHQFKTVEEEYSRERKSLSEAELKTLEETARRRLRADNTFWDDVFAFAPSEDARRLGDLLQSYYLELAELEGKRTHVEAQLDRVQRAEKLAQEESALLEKLLPLIQREVAQAELKKEEEMVRLRARLRPREAEELLKTFEAKTGRPLSLPPPFADAEKPAAVKEGADRIADLTAQTLAGRKWLAVIEERLSPTGIKAEIGDYQDKLGNLNAASARMQRRMQALSGGSNEVGIIGETRTERFTVNRASGLRIFGTVVGLLLLAFVLGRVVDGILNRFGGQDGAKTPQSQFVYSFLRVILKLLIWVVCLVAALSTLGFSVGAILAGMGIGGLAIGLAAKATLEDIISGLVIFMERPFKIGDTLQIGSAPPAKVVGMTWRSTRLEDSFGYVSTVPNSKVASSTIQNFTRDDKAVDYLTVNVPAKHEVAKVIRLMEEAIAECPSIAREQKKGVLLAGLESVSEGGGGTMKYLPWWHVSDYNQRHVIRHELSALIWKRFVKGGIVEAQVEPATTAPAVS